MLCNIYRTREIHYVNITKIAKSLVLMSVVQLLKVSSLTGKRREIRLTSSCGGVLGTMAGVEQFAFICHDLLYVAKWYYQFSSETIAQPQPLCRALHRSWWLVLLLHGSPLHSPLHSALGCKQLILRSRDLTLSAP